MSILLDHVLKNLTDDHLSNISQKLGETPEATKSAVEQALPLLIGAIGKNASQVSNGWSMLSTFLDKNHDGAVLDDMIRMVTGGETPSASSDLSASVLSTILGSQEQRAIADKVSSESSMSAGAVTKLLPLLAPLLVGALAKVQKSENLSQETLSNFLEVEHQKVASSSASTQSFLSGLLDRNGDGNVMDDVMKSGAGILGKLLS